MTEEEREEKEEEGNNNQPSQLKEKLLALSLSSLPPLLPLYTEDSNPREQLEEVAKSIAQLTSSIGTVSSPCSLQQLSVLQASLMNLQQQQLRQFKLLSSLQQQEGGDIKELAEKLDIHNPFVTQLLEKQKLVEEQEQEEQEGEEEEEERAASPPRQELNGSGRDVFPLSEVISSPYQKVASETPGRPPVDDSLSSAIITDHEPMLEKPVNTLELLQQKSASILQSASMGVLANNLADLSATPYPGSNTGKEDDRSVKHKCRYCGKVFGSDSALSIHIRSHTGERPYKCNICGNRFTTKGNLKVHFQRHSDRFPHVKMNPNMVLEHLDKFYPALLQQCEEAEKKGLPMPNINNPMAGMAPVVPPGMTLPTNLPGMTPPPLSPSPAPLSKSVKISPLPPTTPKMPLTMGALPRYPTLPTVPIKKEDIMKERPSWLKGFPLLERPPLEKSFDSDIKQMVGDDCFPIKNEIKEEKDMSRPPPMELLLPRYPLPRSRMESLSPRSLGTPFERRDNSLPDEEQEREQEEGIQKMSEGSSEDGSFQEEPENLSNGKREAEEEGGDSLLDKLHKEVGIHSFPRHLLADPTKDPNLYNVLLPRPGSTDNSWESLIEVDKSNESTKLESLVMGLDTKTTETNECILCRRVLSCKSALQMHYRIHTGERPFKCKICNRTFTTKGNLKTHMGVHRSKPPLRSFPQCPVCHKKYANMVVLQQHIRTHTGEKTDMSIEQISAAEIRDFQSGDGPNIPFGLPAIRPPGDPLNKFLPQFPSLASPRALILEDEAPAEDKLSRPSSVSSSASIGSNLTSGGGLGGFPPYSASFSASLAALEKQVRTMDGGQGKVAAIIEDKGHVRGQDTMSYSGDQSPEDKTEEPEDLSKPSEDRTELHRTSPIIEDTDAKEAREEKEEKEEERRQTNGEMLGSSSPPRQDLGPRPPLPLGLHNLPPLSGFPALFPSGLPPLPFPLPGLSPLPGPPPAGFPPLGLGFPGIRHPLMEDIFAARGRTTCQICFKVFACNSALEIHMRSHTKERPFKCDVCGKGFTTKGNMKQHQMTHKFRDAAEDPALPSSSPGERGAIEAPSSSPITSPPSSEPLSPPYRGEKRPGEEGVSLQPEKRAILCG